MNTVYQISDSRWSEDSNVIKRNVTLIEVDCNVYWRWLMVSYQYDICAQCISDVARNSVRSLITTSVTISLHLTTFFKQFVWMIFTKYCKMRMQNFQFGTTACYCKTNIMFSFSYCVNIMDSYLRWHCCLLALNKPHAAKFLKCFCSSNVTVCFQMSDVFALLFKSSVCLCWILKESIFSQTVLLTCAASYLNLKSWKISCDDWS